MNRLEAELQRLHLPDATGAEPTEGRHGAIVLEVLQAAGWEPVGKLWQGVQADLDLPAPAIAVNGRDGYQLWFAFQQPVAAAEAQAFAEGLRGRYLADIPPERLRIGPAPVPPAAVGPDRWSAFVAPDLAPLFAQEPWLDLAPSPDAQAELLSRIQPIPPDALQRAVARLRATAAPPAVTESAASTPAPATAPSQDPRRFLLDVMNDPGVDLRLRIEAAKALLSAGRERGG